MRSLPTTISHLIETNSNTFYRKKKSKNTRLNIFLTHTLYKNPLIKFRFKLCFVQSPEWLLRCNIPLMGCMKSHVLIVKRVGQERKKNSLKFPYILHSIVIVYKTPPIHRKETLWIRSKASMPCPIILENVSWTWAHFLKTRG